jgi:hypothetical protein
MRQMLRLQIIALFFVIAFYSVYAFASSSTNELQTGGEGASLISGWTISNIHYQLGQDPSQIAAVDFDLDRPAAVVQVSLNSAGAVFFPCQNIGSTHWSCTINPEVSLASSDQLRVIATGN